MKPFSIVVAMDQQRGIGKNGTLPWHLPADLKHFKEVTQRTQSPETVNAVIMGRKTWDSLPPQYRPLPGRLNVVLSRQSLELPAGVECFTSLDEALEALSNPELFPHLDKVFVIGGGEIFKLSIDHPYCESIYLTAIGASMDCDTFLPAIPPAFKEVSFSPVQFHNDLPYHFVHLKRPTN